MGHKIEKGSRELSQIRKELREITALVNERLKAAGHRHMTMTLDRKSEKFGGYNDGYNVDYTLRNLTMASGVNRLLDLSFAYGQIRDLTGRVEVKCWGTIQCQITYPARTNIIRNDSGWENKLTYAEDRDVKAKASSVLRLINQVVEKQDIAYEYVTGEVKKWDAFADRCNRLRKVVGITRANLEEDNYYHTPTHLKGHLQSNSTRKHSVYIRMSRDSKKLDLSISNISEQKLKQVMDLLK